MSRVEVLADIFNWPLILYNRKYFIVALIVYYITIDKNLDTVTSKYHILLAATHGSVISSKNYINRFSQNLLPNKISRVKT